MEQFVKQYIQTHEQVYNYFGEVTKRTMNLAAVYALANKPFSGMTLQKTIDELNSLLSTNFDTVNVFRSNIVDENVAVQFLIGDYTSMEPTHLAMRYSRLVQAGFPKKPSTLTAALYLTDHVAHATRAYDLHKAMKKYHPFLTGLDDIPICVFIMQNEELNSEQVAKLMNDYYEELKGTFTRGDALQLLSQLLVLWSPSYNENLTPYVKQLKVEFENRGVRISRSMYYLMGILALNTSDNAVIEEVIALYKPLIGTKLLKYNKEIALQIAVRKVVQQKVQELNAASLGVDAKLRNLLDTMQFIGQLPIGISSLVEIPFLD